eukprot:gb/GFBE01076352.1/.p1 GENE.gb/GFBE01076352.1/~~gb/GFBE01076352.1/.p1  ORF type:complete len:741 (+),score=50.75 gb/GFBE01076352.1/:1-2223(+)
MSIERVATALLVALVAFPFSHICFTEAFREAIASGIAESSYMQGSEFGSPRVKEPKGEWFLWKADHKCSGLTRNMNSRMKGSLVSCQRTARRAGHQFLSYDTTRKVCFSTRKCLPKRANIRSMWARFKTRALKIGAAAYPWSIYAWVPGADEFMSQLAGRSLISFATENQSLVVGQNGTLELTNNAMVKGQTGVQLPAVKGHVGVQLSDNITWWKMTAIHFNAPDSLTGMLTNEQGTLTVSADGIPQVRAEGPSCTWELQLIDKAAGAVCLKHVGTGSYLQRAGMSLSMIDRPGNCTWLPFWQDMSLSHMVSRLPNLPCTQYCNGTTLSKTVEANGSEVLDIQRVLRRGTCVETCRDMGRESGSCGRGLFPFTCCCKLSACCEKAFGKDDLVPIAETYGVAEAGKSQKCQNAILSLNRGIATALQTVHHQGLRNVNPIEVLLAPESAFFLKPQELRTFFDHHGFYGMVKEIQRCLLSRLQTAYAIPVIYSMVVISHGLGPVTLPALTVGWSMMALEIEMVRAFAYLMIHLPQMSLMDLWGKFRSTDKERPGILWCGFTARYNSAEDTLRRFSKDSLSRFEKDSNGILLQPTSTIGSIVTRPSVSVFEDCKGELDSALNDFWQRYSELLVLSWALALKRQVYIALGDCARGKGIEKIKNLILYQVEVPVLGAKIDEFTDWTPNVTILSLTSPCREVTPILQERLDAFTNRTDVTITCSMVDSLETYLKANHTANHAANHSG